MILFGTVGLWLVLTGLLALAGWTIPPGLAWATLIAVASFLLSDIGYWLGGEQHSLAAAGYVLGMLSETVWAAWLARYLLAARAAVMQ